MVFIQPIVSDLHGYFKDPFELLSLLLFVEPLQVIFGEGHREIGGWLFVDSGEEAVDPVFVFVCHILRWVVETQILYYPLIIVAKLEVSIGAFLVGLSKKLTPDLLAHLSGVFVEASLIFELLQAKGQKSVVALDLWLQHLHKTGLNDFGVLKYNLVFLQLSDVIAARDQL